VTILRRTDVTNKINGLNSSAAAIGAARPADKARDVVTGGSSNGSSGTAASSSGGDVHITDSASTLATLEQAVRALPAVDETRVAQLQSAIDQGTYKVQPQHIADQLIHLERTLGRLPDTEEPVPSRNDRQGL
jgi:negative regulator of flagellin synthesis FlgM